MLGLLNFFCPKCKLFAFLVFTVPIAYGQTAFEGSPISLTQFNSVYDENFLTVESDGSIYYSRLKNPSNPGGSSTPGYIWFAVNDSILSAELWNVQDSAALNIFIGTSRGVSYYGSIVEEFGAPVTTIYGLKGGKTRKVDIPYFVNESPIISGSISADGNFMILSLEGRTTFGVEDIYVCRRKSNGTWEAPRNLGSSINTNFQELTPSLSQDNTVLSWSSNGRDGEGSFDVYQSTRLDESWQNWSEPINVGQINTIGAETSFQMVGEYAYFVSTQDSDGYGDIKKIKLKEPVALFEEDTLVDEEPHEDLIRKLIVLVDEISGQAINGKVVVNSASLDSTYQDTNSVNFKLSELEDLKLEVSAIGYVAKGLVYTATELGSREVFQVQMTPLTVGTTVKLENVLFARGTTDFVGGSEIELKRVVEMMESNPELKILVKGHTDNRGNEQKNLELSEQRAQKVRQYIVDAGIDAGRVESKGFGGSVPIASNENEFTRKLNRRVEFTVVEQ